MTPKETPEKQPESPTGSSQSESYDRTVEGVTPVGMGATEEDTDEMIHEGNEPPSGYKDNPLIDNISQDDPEVFEVQTDSPEGQAHIKTDEGGNPDETKQST